MPFLPLLRYKRMLLLIPSLWVGFLFSSIACAQNPDPNAVEITGDYVIKPNDCFRADFQGERNTHLLMDQKTGKGVALDVTGLDMAKFRTGSRLKVRGRMARRNTGSPARPVHEPILKASAMEVVEEPAATAEPEPPTTQGGSSTEPPPKGSAVTTTDFKCLLLFANTSDYTVNATKKTTSENYLFGTGGNVSEAFHDSTYGYYRLVQGDSVILDLTTSTAAGMDSDDMRALMHNKALAMGYDPVTGASKTYQRVFFFMPNGVTEGGSASWTAWAYIDSIGGAWGHSVYSYNWSGAFFDGHAHENSHNCGLQHSSEGASEYGDETCVMGLSHSASSKTAIATLNPAKKAQLGVFNGYPGSKVDLSADNTLDLYPLAISPATQPGVRCVTFAGKTYYIAYMRDLAPYGKIWTNDSTKADKVVVYSCANFSSFSYITTSITEGGSYNAGDVNIRFERYGNTAKDYATVSFNLADGNTKPVANAQSRNIPVNMAKAITLTGSDADAGDTVTYTVVANPSNGTLSGSAPNLTYTPNNNYVGADSFVFKVHDGKISSFATVSLTVTADNLVPVADNQSVDVDFNTAQPITLTATDDNNDPLAYSIVSGPSHGSLSVVSGANFTYTPHQSYSGGDSFTFKVNDTKIDSNTATVTINVAPPQLAPAVDTFGNGTLIVPITASGGTGTVGNLQTDDDTTYSVAKSGIMTVGGANGFNTHTGTINSVYLFVQYSVEPGYTGTNPIKVNGVNTTIVPVDGDYGRWGYIDITGGAFNVDTSAEIQNLSVTFTNNDTGGGDAVFFDCIYVVVNPTSPIPIHPTWTEDFNGTGAANPLVWNYELGYQRNNELQYYMQGTSNGWQENGNFVIEGRKETVNGYAYTSASIVTSGKYYWHYGRAQIRAQIPAKAGMWPAIWGTGDTGEWPSNGEVDILEYYGDKILANCARGTTTRWTAAWDSSNRTMSTLTSVAPNWRTQWHVWTIQWDDLNVRLYCDNILMNTIPQSWLVNPVTTWGPQYPFKDNGMSCWLNLAMGGAGGDPTATMNSGPQRYLIDYWKIWEGATNNVAPTDIALDHNEVLDGASAGAVVGNLTASDADPAEVLRYSLVAGTGDTHNSQFTIPEFISDNTLAGVLKTATVLNAADGPTRSIRVRVTDIEGATYDRVFTIQVISLGKRVYYNGNGSTAGNVPTDSTPYESGATVTVLGNTGGLAKTGHTFTGWNTAANGSGAPYSPGATFAITDDVTLHAQWVPNSYTVTFDPNGGGTPSPLSKQVTFGSTYGTLATVTRSGYSFNGWFTAASGGTEVTSPSGVTITSNQTLYAQWTLIPLSVVTNTSSVGVPEGSTTTFEVKLSHQPAGDTIVTVARSAGDADISIQSGVSLIFTTANWDTYQTVTLAAAIDADAQNGTATISCSSSNPAYTAAEITAAEIDKETTLTVTSGGNGSTSPSGAIIVLKGATTAISATANEGYDFVNWTVTSGAASLGNANAASTTTSITGPATVQANFTPKTYAVTYDGNGNTSGTAPANGNKIHGVNLTLATNSGNLTKTGYSFRGWNTAPDGSGTDYPESGSYTNNAPLTLYAKWSLGVDLYWSGDGLTLGGTGNWDTTNARWGADVAGPFSTVWKTGNSLDRAVFGGAAGIVTLTTEVMTGGLTFNTAGYSITGSKLTLASGTTIHSTVGTGISDDPAITSELGGGTGFTKTGSGWLGLKATTSSLSGNVNVQAGTLYSRHEALGSGNNIVFTGNSTLIKFYNANSNFTQGISINDGVTATLSASSFYHNANVAGALAGGTSSKLILSQGNNTEFQFNNTANTFTGELTINGGGTADGGSRAVFKSLADSSQKIIINNALLRSASGGAAMNFANRQLEMLTNNARLDNDSGNTIGFSKDLIATIGNNARTLILSGTNTGNNSFSGVIANSATGSGAVGVQKLEAGKWILGNSNTYTGKTTVNGGTLEVASLKNLNTASSVGMNNAMHLGYFNTAGTLRYVGAGDSTNRPVYINDYSAGTGNTASGIILNDGSGALTFTASTFIPTDEVVVANRSLELGGSYTGGANEIQGLIQDIAPVAGKALISVVKRNDASTWTLSGNNSYTGTTTISGGKLFINGDQSLATGAISVASGATLGGSGAVGGDVTIASGGKLEFGISTAVAEHNPLNIASAKTMTFSGASTLTITSSGGASPGVYKLVTGGSITGSAPATLILPQGWVASVSIVNNELVLDVTSVGVVGPGPVDHFLITGIPSQVTIGTGITGITITAQDAANETATSFTGTVTFGGTAGITGTSASFTAGVLTGVSITPMVAGSGLTVTVGDGAGHTGSAMLTVQSLFEDWAGSSGLTGGDAGPGVDPDGDGLSNLQEFAFGTNPASGRPGPIQIDQDGKVVSPGLPEIVNFAAPTEPADFRAVYPRRKDHAMAGLTYTVEFSADLTRWTASNDGLQVLSTESAGAVDAVSVPFPLSVPVTTGDPQAPKFFRVGISTN